MLAQSHLNSTTVAAGSAADNAEEFKRTKYEASTEHYIFSLALKQWDHGGSKLTRSSRRLDANWPRRRESRELHVF